jgi:Mce-associated membrane protein
VLAGQVQAAGRLLRAGIVGGGLFSDDYRSFDESGSRGRDYATGTFATEYAHTTAALKESVVKEQAVVTAKVSSSGVLAAAADKVEVLLYLDQHRRNVTSTSET